MATAYDTAPAEQRKGHQMTILDRFGRPKEVPAGYVLQEGESAYVPMDELHNPARSRRMGDAALASFIRDGAGGKPDEVPAGFFKDAYGRLLPTGTTSGNDRADGKALGFRLAYEADLRDAYKAGDAEPADTSANTAPNITRHGEQDGAEVKKARERYESDMRNAWRQSDPGA
ncbi:hypothetical protein XFLAVUS301_08550 [Xanthobacter flavus]|uniref:Uncharacterized protein n=2 Tax=Xanthobacter flavus TaxID=281 RepID=A0A9W6FIH7_XANFL|nr:hypothetical protein XFLAVUS301_08550 [Xanthobacter flavus]